MRLLILLLLAGCEFGASTKVLGDTGPGSSDQDSGGQTGAGNSDDTGDTSGLHASDIDDDGDGHTENEGDCDDTDPAVHPGLVDDCDGVDSDCDGVVDNDAVDADPYEPNDTVDFEVGELELGDVFAGAAFLHDGADTDRFSFNFEDATFDFFTLTVDLEWGAGDVMYIMTVQNTDTGELLFNGFSTSGERAVRFELGDSIGSADGGQFRVSIGSDGSASCLDGYSLRIALSPPF
jgi:hypothetical protein